jgi:hypothetical protein
VLGAAADLRLDPDLGELLLQDRDRMVDVGLALQAPLGHPALQVEIVLGRERAQRQVLQLGLDLGHAEAMGQRRIDVERLLGHLARSLGRQVVERAHVVEAVGELDHEHAQVARHRHQHLAEVLGLALLAGGEGQLADLGDPVDEVGDLLAELVLELLLGGLGVLEDVVEQAGGDGGDVHLEADEEVGDLQGVREIRLAGGAVLTLVRDLGEAVGALQERQVSAWLVFRNLLDQR